MYLQKSRSILYFAYGSNLLADRIRINSPSAVQVAIGRLDNFRLDFNYYSHRWKGAAATIIAAPDNHVWGVLWKIDAEDVDKLDRQEGIHEGIYHPLQIEVVTPQGELKKARSYQLIRPPEEDRRPSLIYLNVILRGARENQLPEDYIKFLETIEHNGFNGEVDVSLSLLSR